jgi:hypothetical protein
VAIKRAALRDMGIDGQVSPYSYQRGQTVYLEEDNDASLLIGAAKLKGIKLEFVDKYTDKNSPIRSYESFRP